VLKNYGIDISMDGKGAWQNSAMIEHLWYSLKYDCVSMHAFENLERVGSDIGTWVHSFNHERSHQSLGYRVPDDGVLGPYSTYKGNIFCLTKVNH